MSIVDQEFQELCKKILIEGIEYENKNRGVKRLQIPSYTFNHSFSDGFPAITNKKLYWKGIIGELLWFLRGDNDVKFLNDNGIKIWNKDAYNWYVKHCKLNETIPESFEVFESWGKGSVGQNYSIQWRNFNGEVDQIRTLVAMMEEDIMSSRLIVNAWNASEINETALPPCHNGFQIVGIPLSIEQRTCLYNKHAFYEGFPQENKELWDVNSNLANGRTFEQYLDDSGCAKFGFQLIWNQRSVDTFLGLPFNIASYGLLAKILEQMTGFPALGITGNLLCVHFYDNQYEAVKELLERDPNNHPNCSLEIDSILTLDTFPLNVILDTYSISDFKLKGYSSDEEIKVDMLAPKEL